MSTFNPNDPGIANGNYFALPCETDRAQLVLISAPWDVTTSYRPGTAQGPRAMIDASLQIDLFDTAVPRVWEMPVATLPISEELTALNRITRKYAEKVIQAWQSGQNPDTVYREMEKVNEACERLNRHIYHQCSEQIAHGRLVGLVGGEHSVPFGFLQALAEEHESFGILHLDAHADLRAAYEGFTYSHASIMYNVLNRIGAVGKLVQVGIRDYCQEEDAFIRKDPRIVCFTGEALCSERYEGTSWKEQCQRILENLPDKVYVSFDIDALDPALCPSTGTPVPGGLGFNQAVYLLHALAKSDKQLIGFDLCEVAPADNSEWDANVGARILFKLCACCYLNNKK